MLERAGKDLPDWIANAPQPPEHQHEVWSAFATLSDSRRIGMQAGAIPLTEIEAYMRLYRITDPDTVDEWIYLIREMDREYRAASSEVNDK